MYDDVALGKTKTTTAPKTSGIFKAPSSTPTQSTNVFKTGSQSNYTPVPATAPKQPSIFASPGAYTAPASNAPTSPSGIFKQPANTTTPQDFSNSLGNSVRGNFNAPSFTPSSPVTGNPSGAGNVYAPTGASASKGVTEAPVQTDPKAVEAVMGEPKPVSLTPEQQQVQSQAVQSVDSIMQGYQQLQQDAKSMGNEGLIALAAQWDKMVSTIDAVQAQITDQIKSQMNGDDPAMQNAINLIKQEAETMRKDTLDELNARGLVQSGVYAQSLSDMNKNELTQIQTAVSSRFGDLQTQLNSAIMSLAQTRISALAANQSSMASMMQNTQSNVLNAGLAGMNAQVTTRGQDIQSNQFNQSLTQNQNQFNQTMSYNRDNMSQSNQQFYDQLSQQDKQFYDQLSQNEKLALASQASSGGAGSAANSLAQMKFQFEQQQYADGIAAGNQANTYQQVGQAMGAGGTVEQMINKITSGAYTVGQVRSMISGSGMTQDAQYQVLNAITSDAGVQKKINSGTKTSSYTPKTDSNKGSNTITGGYAYK